MKKVITDKKRIGVYVKNEKVAEELYKELNNNQDLHTKICGEKSTYKVQRKERRLVIN